MRHLPFAVSLVMGLGLVVACGDDDAGDDGGAGGEGNGGQDASGTAGVPSGSDGGSSSGGGGGPAASDCDALAETLIPDLGAWSISIAASDERVAYVTRVDVATATELSVLAIDGGDPELIYSSTEGTAINSIAFSSGSVVFLEAPDGDANSTLYSVPAGGGDAEQVGGDTFENARLLGADADFAYVYVNAVDGKVLRVDLTSGISEVAGNLPAPGTLVHHSIEAGELFFVAGGGLQTAYRLDLSATEADPEEVFDGSGSSGCGFPLGGLVATPARLVCGYYDMASYARDDGSAEGISIEGDRTTPPAHIVVATSDESVYMVEVNDGTVDRALRRANSDGSDETALACDVGKVATQTVDGFFPLSNHYQVAVGGGRIFWIEERVPTRGADPTISLRSSAL